jgi:hypothetical protein
MWTLHNILGNPTTPNLPHRMCFETLTATLLPYTFLSLTHYNVPNMKLFLLSVHPKSLIGKKVTTHKTFTHTHTHTHTRVTHTHSSALHTHTNFLRPTEKSRASPTRGYNYFAMNYASATGNGLLFFLCAKRSLCGHLNCMNSIIVNIGTHCSLVRIV